MDRESQLIWESWADAPAPKPQLYGPVGDNQVSGTTAHEEPLLTPDQDNTIKEIYLKISSFIDEFIRARSITEPPSSGLTGEPMDVARYQVYRNVDWSKLEVTQEGSFVVFDPADIQRWQIVFPELNDNFKLGFPDMDSRAEIDRRGGKIHSINIRYKDLMSGNETRMKASLQHELQHMVQSGEKGADPGPSVIETILYLAGEDEIRSHAKEAAYYFSKMVPGDPTFDYNKLLAAGVKSKDIQKYYYYIQKFNDPNGRAETMQKHSLDPQFDTVMKDAGEKFVRYVQQFLTNSYYRFK